MSDLISRQAAVDAMMRLQTEDIEMYGCAIPEVFDGDRAAEALKALPSANIICCRECKHVEHDKLFHELWCMGREVKPDHYCGYAERMGTR